MEIKPYAQVPLDYNGPVYLPGQMEQVLAALEQAERRAQGSEHYATCLEAFKGAQSEKINALIDANAALSAQIAAANYRDQCAATLGAMNCGRSVWSLV